MTSFNTLGAFREAAKVTQERLIKEDLVTVRGKEVTVLRRLEKQTAMILPLSSVSAYVFVDFAYRSFVGNNAFQILCWFGTFVLVALQIWRVWVETRYRARMAWLAGCDVMWRRNMWAPHELNTAENADEFASKVSTPAKEAVKKLMKQEFKSFFSRRHIGGYTRLGRFPLIWLLLATGLVVYCTVVLHAWDHWPPFNRPFFVCAFSIFIVLVSLVNALQKWLEDMITCAVFALTPAMEDKFVSRHGFGW